MKLHRQSQIRILRYDSLVTVEHILAFVFAPRDKRTCLSLCPV
jgi:hypothetical protein